MDWLLAPIDLTRPHDLGPLLSWHGRVMTLAWGVMIPLGVLIARFYKIMPRQNWPVELDNRTWWWTHLGLQQGASMLMVVGLALILLHGGDGDSATTHRLIGWGILMICALQLLSGWLRGSRGGPDEHKHGQRGDHYEMSWRRCLFERFHKTIGYSLILMAWYTILLGMWAANAPVWMWLCIGMWWSILVVAFVILQSRGLAIDTYQAIYGPDDSHPGNRRPPIGWGVKRRPWEKD